MNALIWKPPALFFLLLCLELSILPTRLKGATLIAEGRSDWKICLSPNSGKVERFAAQELSRYLARLSGVALPIVYGSCDRGPSQVEIRAGNSEQDGYEILIETNRLTISGEGPRGALYAVYELLKKLGCRWYYLGEQGEVIPQRNSVDVSEGQIKSRPAFPQRSLILIDEYDLHFVEMDQWIDWAAKARINNLFICGHPPGLTELKHWWLAERDRLLQELQKRGIILEFGGHFMPSLLPRYLFSGHPEYFRMNAEGKRVDDFNFCPTNKETQRLVKENAKQLFRQLPEVQYHHLWPDDIRGGGWCSGPECQGLKASDQALLAANVVAEALAEIGSQARLAYLAYHDTSEPPSKIKPHPQLFLLNAPRERCYAHGIADSRCKRNHEIYLPAWERLLTLFESDHRKDSHTFEYYHDLILFKAMQPPLLRVMQNDALYYLEKQTPVLQSLMTRNRHFVAPPIALYAYSEFAWNPVAQPDSVLRDFCLYFGPAAELMQKYFSMTEKGFDLVLTLDDFLEEPWPGDALDFHLKPKTAANRKINQLDEARRLHNEASQHLAKAIEESKNDVFRHRLQAERDVWEVHNLGIALRQSRFAGWYYAEEFELTDDPKVGRKAMSALLSALKAIEGIQTWGAEKEVNHRYLSLLNSFCIANLRHVNSLRAKVYDRLKLYVE